MLEIILHESHQDAFRGKETGALRLNQFFSKLICGDSLKWMQQFDTKEFYKYLNCLHELYLPSTRRYKGLLWSSCTCFARACSTKESRTKKMSQSVFGVAQQSVKSAQNIYTCRVNDGASWHWRGVDAVHGAEGVSTTEVSRCFKWFSPVGSLVKMTWIILMSEFSSHINSNYWIWLLCVFQNWLYLHHQTH